MSKKRNRWGWYVMVLLMLCACNQNAQLETLPVNTVYSEVDSSEDSAGKTEDPDAATFATDEKDTVASSENGTKTTWEGETEAFLQTAENPTKYIEASTKEQEDVLKHFYVGGGVSAEIDDYNSATILSKTAGVVDLCSPFWWSVYSDEWNKETVTQLIDRYQLPQGEYYLDGERLTTKQKDELMMLRAMNSVPANPVCLYGVISRETPVKMFPTEKRLTIGEKTQYDATDRETFDRLRESALMVGEAVILLNTSTDGAFYFVQAENTFGWVRKADVVLCDYDTMCHWITAMDFVVVTAQSVTFHSTQEERTMRMGTRLLLYTDTDSYCHVLLPCDAKSQPQYALTTRNGSLDLIYAEQMEEGDLPVTYALFDKTELSIGYLPLNDKMVKEQAEKLLGTPYGWGDEDGMDCSSTMLALYRCFGIKLPRNTAQLMNTCGGNATIVQDISKMTGEQRYETIISQKPGTLLLLPGHVVLYMGEIEGTPMILHNVVAYMDESNTVCNFIGACVLTPLDIVSADLHYYEKVQYIIAFY